MTRAFDSCPYSNGTTAADSHYKAVEISVAAAVVVVVVVGSSFAVGWEHTVAAKKWHSKD